MVGRSTKTRQHIAYNVSWCFIVALTRRESTRCTCVDRGLMTKGFVLDIYFKDRHSWRRRDHGVYVGKWEDTTHCSFWYQRHDDWLFMATR